MVADLSKLVEVWIRDPGLQRRGRVEILSGSAVLRESGVGTWVLTMPAENPVVQRIAEGWGVMVRDQFGARFSGPVTKISTAYGITQNVEVAGVTDMVVLADRLTYPDPANGPASQSTAYYKDSGAAGAVISRLVDRNCGAGAIAARRTRGFTAPSSTLGASTTINTRLKPVIEEVSKLATAGGLVVDVVQDGVLLKLTQRRAQDLARAVRLTRETGEVGAASMSLSAPEATVVVVGGQGTGASRQLVERAAPVGGWGGRRIEVFQDRRDTDDANELTKSADETLTGAAGSATASIEVRDTDNLRFGTDYLLGDTVTVDLGGGARLSDGVRVAEIAWTTEGRTVALTVGSHDSEDDRTPKWVKKVAALTRKLRALESI